MVSTLLCNALSHYCYMPMIVGSLICNKSPIISISTAQYMLILTFKNI